jgi:3-isopropylmalate/(R)-2-methylmalate dehydratase large subunit
MSRTLYQKVWDAHAVLEGDDGQTLLHVARHLAHDGSCHAFDFLRARGLGVRRPDQVYATPDHAVPSRGRDDAAFSVPEHRRVVHMLTRNTREHGIVHFGLDDERQGIVHVVGPELGLTQPGMLLVCGDSHTSTHGALGALAFGIGASEVMHVLATQATWQKRSRSLRVTVEGMLPVGVTAKDLSLAIVSGLGANGAAGHVIEYAGSTVRALSIEQRLTLCNMSIEAGARTGMVAPDDVTYEYLQGRPHAPRGAQWDRALAWWRTLPSDADARHDRELGIDARTLSPMVTWGNTAADALPVEACVPDPGQVADPVRRRAMYQTLSYMDLRPGMPLTDIEIDQVFIGSCTNARLDDLRDAARVVRGRRAVVPALVVPGSTQVKRAAEAEGLDRVFRDAGFRWGEAGCSLCVGMNGDVLAAGQRCASTSNRNNIDRQGPGSRTHLLSPAMAAAAAITGHITDVRQLEH